jgi:hypothetical protein
MRSLFIIFAMVTGQFLFSDESVTKFIDPTGTYTLVGKVKKNLVVSHSGEIRVRLLDSGKLAICFYMNKGYPGYQSGSFIDTLPYIENAARYTPPTDTNCTIVFQFTLRAVETMALYNAPQCNCGLGAGVITAAIFDKSSGDKPIIQDLAAHRISS